MDIIYSLWLTRNSQAAASGFFVVEVRKIREIINII